MNAENVTADILWAFREVPFVLLLLAALPLILLPTRWCPLFQHPPSSSTRSGVVRVGAALTCAAPLALVALAGIWRNHQFPPGEFPKWKFGVLVAVVIAGVVGCVVSLIMGTGARFILSVLAGTSLLMMCFAWFVAVCAIGGVGP
jgi:hypothetical protein